MSKCIMLLVVLISACRAAQPDTPPPNWIIGKYHYSGNGTVAGKFPWEAKANLVLDPDAQYTLSVEVHVNDEKGGDTDSDESYGSYYVDGNRLILQPADDEEGDTEEFEIQGRRLVPKLPWPARVALRGFKVPDPMFVKTQ